MYKRLFTICGLLAATAILLATPTIVKHSVKKPAAVSSYEDAADESRYIMRTHENRIGVFDGSEKLVFMLEIDVLTLPESDRTALSKGIRIADEDELNRRIEDYSS